MYKTEGSIKDGNAENFLFTYSEEEKQNNEINRVNAKLAFSPKFIPFYPVLSEIGLDNTETLLYGFIDFYLSSGKTERFYFTNEQLSSILNVSERKITDSIKKLKEIGLICPKYKIRNEGGKIRFINNKDFVPIEEITRKNKHYGLAKNSTLESQNLLGIDNKIKYNKIKENKNNIHQNKFDVLFSYFGLDRARIEKWFKYKKSLDDILEDCKRIAYISSELEIEVTFTKDTINAVDIIRKREFTIDYVIDWIKENRTIEETFGDLIRSDYYLPVEISK